MLVTLPIAIPMLGAALCLLAWSRVRAQEVIAVVCSGAVLACGVLLIGVAGEHGPQVAQVSAWDAPFGISLVGDLFSAIMLTLNGIVGLVSVIYSIAMIDEPRARHGYYALVLALLASVSGAFLAGDLFNLYVWFELMLMSSFVLLTLGGERGQIEGGIKYVALNLLSSTIFLAAVGLIYGVTGTLNFAHLSQRFDMISPALATTLGVLVLVAFAIKAAVFPFFFWLPASYHTPPTAVSALFAGLLTKVGVYSFIRFVTLVLDQERTLVGEAVIILAGLTMVTGVFGAVVQNDMRRILSFHIVSQIGYMLMGLGVAVYIVGRDGDSARDLAAIALAGSVFYILHHIIVKTNLFLISGIVERARGTSGLAGLGGLIRSHPLLAGLFLVSSMSLAGIPILSGFWAKLTLIRSGLEARTYGIVAVALFVSIMTLFSMTKIWSEAFWRAEPAPGAKAPREKAPALATACVAAMAGLTLMIGFGAAPAYRLAARAAEQLLDNQTYIRAVLGERAAPGGEAP